MERSCEVAWFAALCDDDYEFLGVADPALRSSWTHCRDIALAAESGGFDRILLPSGYRLGIDGAAFAGGMAPLLSRLRLLLAIRTGELWPPQQARQIATLDQMLQGRLDINIISSDLPGETLDSAPRYRRTLEAMQICVRCWKDVRSTTMASITGSRWSRRAFAHPAALLPCSISAACRRPRGTLQPPARTSI